MRPLAILLLIVTPAAAGQLNLGRVTGTYSGTGGEFNITATNLDFVGGVPALNDHSFQTGSGREASTLTMVILAGVFIVMMVAMPYLLNSLGGACIILAAPVVAAWALYVPCGYVDDKAFTVLVAMCFPGAACLVNYFLMMETR